MKKSDKLWKHYRVTLDFEHRLCGSVPQSKELIRPWLDARKPKTKPEDSEKSLDEIEQEVMDSIEETEERVTLGFQKDDKGLFVRGGTLKAHLKDCANQMKEVLGVRALRNKTANKVYVNEYKVYLLKNGAICQEECGSFDQPVHVMTALGPRNALKTIRYVERPQLHFTLMLLQDKEITEEVVRKIFEYASIHGYGGERSMGEGRYQFSMKAL